MNKIEKVANTSLSTEVSNTSTANTTSINGDNVVTLRLPAAWFAVLLNELQFCGAILDGRSTTHSRENCHNLWRLLVEQSQSMPELPKIK